jgi:hypothetical protein
MAFAVNRTMSYTRYFEAVDLVFSGATGEPGPNSSAPLTIIRIAGKPRRIGVGSPPRARIATPFQPFCPCQTAP